MKSILVPLRATEDVEDVLAHAAKVAVGFRSYVEGLVIEPVFNKAAVGEAMVALPIYEAQVLKDWRAKAKATHQRFDEIMNQLGIPVGKSASHRDVASAGWQELIGLESAVVGEYGRLFDLIVLGRAREDDRGEVMETCEAALFETGRPVLVVPRGSVNAVGGTIVVSWNGSTETARTIGLGMPFIEAAKMVFVLTVEGATVPGPSGEQVVDHLSRRGISAKSVAAEPADRSAGAAILEEAAALGADLLFKGAYTHSRLRQLVFGGPTKHILSHADIPVLMAH